MIPAERSLLEAAGRVHRDGRRACVSSGPVGKRAGPSGQRAAVVWGEHPEKHPRCRRPGFRLKRKWVSPRRWERWWRPVCLSCPWWSPLLFRNTSGSKGTRVRGSGEKQWPGSDRCRLPSSVREKVEDYEPVLADFLNPESW